MFGVIKKLGAFIHMKLLGQVLMLFAVASLVAKGFSSRILQQTDFSWENQIFFFMGAGAW